MVHCMLFQDSIFYKETMFILAKTKNFQEVLLIRQSTQQNDHYRNSGTENEVLSLKDHVTRILMTYHFYTLS